MMKRITIESCEHCPYSRDGYDIRNKMFYFVCFHDQFPYGRSNWAIKDQIMYDCPLDDVVGVSSIGDLTPEDIQCINETARRIQNTKNVREGRYG